MLKKILQTQVISNDLLDKYLNLFFFKYVVMLALKIMERLFTSYNFVL